MRAATARLLLATKPLCFAGSPTSRHVLVRQVYSRKCTHRRHPERIRTAGITHCLVRAIHPLTQAYTSRATPISPADTLPVPAPTRVPQVFVQQLAHWQPPDRARAAGIARSDVKAPAPALVRLAASSAHQPCCVRSFLRRRECNYNSLAGSLPSEIGRMASLTRV